MISRIEVNFAIPVELTENEERQICDIVQAAAKRTETDEIVHWQSDIGSKPHFSKADGRFLRVEVDDDAPETGEPTWDDSVLQINTCSRERYDSERRKP